MGIALPLGSTDFYRETRKKNKRAAKRDVTWKSSGFRCNMKQRGLTTWNAEKEKYPGIPNSYPYKDQVLAELAANKRAVSTVHRSGQADMSRPKKRRLRVSKPPRPLEKQRRKKRTRKFLVFSTFTAAQSLSATPSWPRLVLRPLRCRPLLNSLTLLCLLCKLLSIVRTSC